MKSDKSIFRVYVFCIFLWGILWLLLISCPEVYSAYVGVEKAVVEAVQKIEPSVVNVKTIYTSSYSGENKEGIGSGIIISKDGWIITNTHVLKNAKKVFITLNDGRTFEAGDWRGDPAEDVAVVKINGSNLPVAKIGNSDNLKKGQIAIAIGNPWKFTSTVTVGCISAINRDLDLSSSNLSLSYKGLIQTDAAINPGNSGGALVNSSGEVIGMNTLVYTGSTGTAQGLSFSIPINSAMNVARGLIQQSGGGKLRPWLGVKILNYKGGGVVITGFPPDSPAQSAGLKAGDIIVAINNKTVNNNKDLQNIIYSLSPGDTVVMIIVRGGQKYQAKVRLEGMRQ